jgi:mevalonate kinase
MIKLSAPSKTFLVGEYAALLGGPCLLLNTEPRFEAVIETEGSGECIGVHPQSPAGLWVRSHREDFSAINFEFRDPHEGRGGFGASGAQFLFAWAWSHMQSKPSLQQALSVDPKRVLADFLSFFSDQATPPSGADVVSQSVGGLLSLNLRPFSNQVFAWPFQQLDFLVVPTGVTLPTHSHLKTLNHEGLVRLRDLSSHVISALKQESETEFLTGLQNFANELATQGKVASHTLSLLHELRSQDGVRLAKGCGAMGSDVVLVIVDKEKKQSVTSRLSELCKTPVADASMVSKGLSLRADLKVNADDHLDVDISRSLL